MKVILDIDVPGDDKFSDAELRQIIFDEVVNFATTRHMEAITRAMGYERKVLDSCENDEEREGVKRGTKQLVALHTTWSDILKDATFEIER